MEPPFKYIWGPFVKCYRPSLRRFCAKTFINQHHFNVASLAFLGMILTIWDIIRLKEGGPDLPENLLGYSGNLKIFQTVISRNLKLMSTICMFQYYFLLFLGAVTGCVTFYMPWLTVQLFNIFMQFLVFIINFIFVGIKGSVHLLFIDMLMALNWSAVFCAFIRGIACDY